jgi:fucose permease
MKSQSRIYLVSLIILVIFVLSFLTNILGPIIPDIIDSFELSLGLAGFLPFSFFVAYGVMSIPSGMLVERYSEKKVTVAAFLLAAIGSLLFAFIPSFPVAMLSLFLIGSGMAMLQVAYSPLLRTAGGEEHFAFNSVIGQLAFGVASFLSPKVYSYLVTRIGQGEEKEGLLGLLESMVPAELSWVSLYWIFAILSLLMVIILLLSRFPKVELMDDEKVGSWQVYKDLFRNKTVILFFLGIFCYVATEQSLANWMSEFLAQYHGIDPQTQGANAVSWFWGSMTLGAILGLILLKFFDSQKVLMYYAAVAIICLLLALMGPTQVALIALPAMGFLLSIMWSVIFSLALNSVEKHHGSFTGILCTAIMGGAIFPLIVGGFGDWIGLRFSLLLLLLTLGFVFSVGIWAKPLVRNKTFLS